jgi:chromosomal replication initiation ATPase DnaA
VRELVKDRKTGEFKNEQVELTKPDPEQIIRAMAKLYNVNSERILKVDRRRNEARDLTAWCMRRLGCLGLSKVGNHLGVQYSTAGHAVSRMNKKMAKDPGLLKKVQKAIFQT